MPWLSLNLEKYTGGVKNQSLSYVLVKSLATTKFNSCLNRLLWPVNQLKSTVAVCIRSLQFKTND